MKERRPHGDEDMKTLLITSMCPRPDFLKSRLHPRALQEMPFRDESSDFGLYTSGGGRGGGVLGERDREAHSDAFRRQLEECNAAQGTQVRYICGTRACDGFRCRRRLYRYGRKGREEAYGHSTSSFARPLSESEINPSQSLRAALRCPLSLSLLRFPA